MQATFREGAKRCRIPLARTALAAPRSRPGRGPSIIDYEPPHAFNDPGSCTVCRLDVQARDTVHTMDTFEALSGRVLKLYGSNHYDVALSLVGTNVALFADHRATFSYWTACLLSLARAFSSLRLTCNQQPASRTTQSPGIRSAPLKPDGTPD